MLKLGNFKILNSSTFITWSPALAYTSTPKSKLVLLLLPDTQIIIIFILAHMMWLLAPTTALKANRLALYFDKCIMEFATNKNYIVNPYFTAIK